MHLLAHLGDALLAVFLQFLTGSNHGNPIVDLVVDALHNLRLRHLDTVDGSLMQEKLLHGNLLRNRTVWIADELDAICLRLQAGNLDVRLEDSLISNYPDHLVNNTSRVD